MEEWKKRKKIVIIFGIFLLVMFLGTIVSKGIYASGLPQVTTTTPIKSGIVHTIEAEGSIRQGKESALNTITGLRVKNIYVRVGDMVNPEDVLFDVDMEELAEQITEKEREIRKLELQIADIQKNISLELQRKETELNRAKEDYKSAEDKANREITDADGAIADAEEKLRDHEKNPVKETGAEERKKKEQEYQEWVKQKKQLEEAVFNASEERLAAESAKQQAEAALQEAEEKGETEDVFEPLREALQQATDVLAEKEKAYTEAQDALEKHLNNPVQKPDYSEEDAAKKAWEAQREQLKEAVESAKAGKENAELAKQDVMKAAERTVEDAGQEQSADSTLEMYQLTLETHKEEMEKYTAIREKEGKIPAEVTGMITAINVAVGERTGDSPVAKIADLTQSLDFTATITESQKKYVNKGDSANIRWSGGDSGKEEVTIDYLTENEYESGYYEITSILPEGSGMIGQSGVLTMSVQSQSYDCCVPLDAVHTDGNGRKFVYVMSRKESILGTELAVRAVFVTVLDQNEKYAALESGVIDGETEVITSSTGELSDGIVVRYKEW